MTRPAPLPPTLAWIGDANGHLELLDQTSLPHEVTVLRLDDTPAVIDAIRRLAVRGAPAIGVAAAYGLVLGVRAAEDVATAAPVVAETLRAARPTAVNLGWALDRCLRRLATEATVQALFDEACRIHCDEEAMARGIVNKLLHEPTVRRRPRHRHRLPASNRAEKGQEKPRPGENGEGVVESTSNDCQRRASEGNSK